MRVVIIQPTIPAYRTDFFDRLHAEYGDDLVVYHSTLPMGAISGTHLRRRWLHKLGKFLTVFPGLEWQFGVAGIDVRRDDIVVIPGAPRNISNLVLLIRARLIGARTIWWGHYWSATTRLWRFYIRMILMRLAHAVMFYTDAEVEEYRRTSWRHDPRTVTAINNGINTDPIKALRLPYAAGDRARRILFIGRLTVKAGLPLLLEAIAQPAAADIHLDIIGDGDSLASLQARASELGISERVTWHGGTADETAIAVTANRARLFVYPGDVGLSLIHAMAYGLPTVIHNERHAHMPEFAAFSEGETGWSFDRGDAGALAAVLARHIDDDDALDRASARATEAVDDSFNTEFMAKRFAALIAQLSATR
jgi:glycosyltransferase involved in cell wall biosynthesis